MPSSTPAPLNTDGGRQATGSDRCKRTVQRQPRYTCNSTSKSRRNVPPGNQLRASWWSAVNNVSSNSLLTSQPTRPNGVFWERLTGRAADKLAGAANVILSGQCGAVVA